ncbi:uncharacterized protein LAESUDRAFT_36747 [Laetiporus sulphureus 93-53]|uniref:Uncharacterized protein n=1 Tax=Laetiporus sulphureus 93-53 TaxID=1314785 RepID=A0A165ILP6_9APHY|nr:uncharacterized protein LAESUDRAFT_36747 [Laetiporus sulphureus 93-53]KZT13252.1 hypothetical protein LAESUDRAFT_36747 [Laetiporus sulphureus 93-53]
MLHPTSVRCTSSWTRYPRPRRYHLRNLPRRTLFPPSFLTYQVQLYSIRCPQPRLSRRHLMMLSPAWQTPQRQSAPVILVRTSRCKRAAGRSETSAGRVSGSHVPLGSCTTFSEYHSPVMISQSDLRPLSPLPSPKTWCQRPLPPSLHTK